MSYTTLCSWLETGEAIGTATQLTGERLNSYSAIFDQLAVVDGHKPFLGLEYHHDSADKMDLSLKGGFELFDLNDLRYPNWLMTLIKSLKDNVASTNLDGNIFYVEFDQGLKGFSLAGFFRSFGSQCSGGKAAIHYPATDYLELFDNLRGCDSKSSKCLASFLSEIGQPDWVGVMARGGNVVKLIASLTQNNIETTKAFCSKYFGKIFNTRGICLDATFFEIQECLPQSKLRVSLDLDLGRDIFLPRFSMEMGPATAGKEAKAWPDTIENLMDCIKISRNHMSEFKTIFAILPKGVKRPTALFSGDLEKLYCFYYHLKANITLSRSTIKSYIGAHYLKE